MVAPMAAILLLVESGGPNEGSHDLHIKLADSSAQPCQGWLHLVRLAGVVGAVGVVGIGGHGGLVNSGFHPDPGRKNPVSTPTQGVVENLLFGELVFLRNSLYLHP